MEFSFSLESDKDPASQNSFDYPAKEWKGNYVLHSGDETSTHTYYSLCLHLDQSAC
jgi:hypothetical protein